MLSPEYLDSLPDELAALLEELETWVISEIARRLSKEGGLTDTAAIQYSNVSSYFNAREINDRIAEVLEYTREQADVLFEEAMAHSIEQEAAFYTASGKWDESAFDPIKGIIEAYKRSMDNDLLNITGSMGFAEEIGGRISFKPIAEFYQSTLNMAQSQVQAGLLDYNTVVRRAVDKMAKSGLRYVDYASGHTSRLDTAVRRAVMTGTNQASGAATELLADELGNDLMEITAHYGARPEHAAWQGKIVSRSGRRGYLSLSDIGYGEVTGFMGANCRHNWFPYLEGSEPSYSRYELEQFKNDTVTFEGKKYTAYEATQKQREYERSIRNTKERIAGYDAAGLKDEMTTQSVRLRRLKNGYKDLCAQTGLKPRSSALQASPYSGFTRSTASKTVWAEKKYLEKYSGYRYNKDGNIIVTDDWKAKGHISTPKKYRPYAVVETVSGKNKQINRTYYDAESVMVKQVHSGNHGYPLRHPYGNNGEHSHRYTYHEDGSMERQTANLSEIERKENADIL